MAEDLNVIERFFGIEDERKIAASQIRQIFTPSQPISTIDLLLGRQAEVRDLVASFHTPGQHALLYGERGVGKSSIANVVGLLLPDAMPNKKVFVKRCDSTDTFETIVQGPLRSINVHLGAHQITEQNDTNVGVDVKILSGTKSKSVSSTYEAGSDYSPSNVADELSEVDGLLIVDEADAISKVAEKRKLAELVKLLSDSGSDFKVLVVGIAKVGAELTAAHPSVARCLREIKLRRMSVEELKSIITVGGAKANLNFSSEVIDAIASLSRGFPYFTHLIALKCSERAIIEGKQEILISDLKEALWLAVNDAEVTLRHDFENATRSNDKPLYKMIVMAAAKIHEEEFSSAQLRRAVSDLSGISMETGDLDNYYSRLIKSDGSSILTRVTRGVYRFSDPRMPSYVGICTALEA